MMTITVKALASVSLFLLFVVCFSKYIIHATMRGVLIESQSL